ncbi:hypothetical protein MTR67_043296 [Solanum verrucosum]|uniref:Uncharacterized protein n=1 Tax=Solanum verrucosum TaxID=315347 RepID=A0AAF0UR36_SOLVR|nr:hypothetical protein MTR67_043296 [Solanum verrucosum]
MQTLRSCRCNPRLPSTDHRSDHGPCRPPVLRSDHGPWSVSVDQGTLYPASDANDGRPAWTVVRSTVRRSDRRLSMGSVAHVEEERKELARDVHRLSRLGVRLMSISDSGVTVQNGA